MLGQVLLCQLDEPVGLGEEICDGLPHPVLDERCRLGRSHARHRGRVRGKPVVVEVDGRDIRLHDDMPRLRAIEVLRKLSERRSRLLGLNAPELHELLVKVDEERGRITANIILSVIDSSHLGLSSKQRDTARQLTAAALRSAPTGKVTTG